ncbi:MAG: type II/IV secretion system protein [Ignavibacteria bacterium]|nr:type II/IV secretion system protein [Ignavibacteria bacterium]MBI3766169.1 type II/IV secretion system protein [Ignavibacteriales bacterium]
MVDLATIIIPPETLALIPKSTVVEHSVLPLSSENGTVLVALPEDYNKEVLNDLSFLLGKNIKVEVAPSEVLTAAIKRLYDVSDVEARKTSLSSSIAISSLTEDHTSQSGGRSFKDRASADGSIVTLVNKIISDAIHMHASDIHVEPYEREVRVRYRLDGVLHEIMQPPFEKAKPLISRLKIMADLDIAEKRRPQDGRIRVKSGLIPSGEGERTIDIRVSTLPTDFGEKIVLRILDKSHLQLDLTKLGFEENDLAIFRRMIRLPFGMILVTGPTGSGKTTTLYAALNHINQPEVNITTIEDPIEYNLVGVNQTHVRADIGLTFAHALRSILRQDPNVIMVGEIRDSETAEIAIRAALTGHLVFSTLHTNDAPSAITRLIDMGIEPFLVAASVKMILAQRLLRTVCRECTSPFQLTERDTRDLAIEGIRTGDQFYRAKGCPSCNQFGYKGRTAVYEVLQIQNGLADLIARSVPTSDVRAMAKRDGFQTLRESALKKAKQGVTTLEEVGRETTS